MRELQPLDAPRLGVLSVTEGRGPLLGERRRLCQYGTPGNRNVDGEAE